MAYTTKETSAAEEQCTVRGTHWAKQMVKFWTNYAYWAKDSTATWTGAHTFSGAVTASAAFTASAATQIAFGSPTYGGDNGYITVGNSTAKTVAIDNYWFPLRMNLINTNNPNAARMFSFIYLNYAQSTEAQGNLDLRGVSTHFVLSKNVRYIWGHYTGIEVTTAISGATGQEFIVGKYQLKCTGKPTAHTMCVLQAQVIGTGGYGSSGGTKLSCLQARVENGASVEHAVDIANIAGSAIVNGINFGESGTITYAFRWQYGQADGSCSAKVGAACDTESYDSEGAIKIQVGTTAYYIPFYTANRTSGSW